MPSLYELTGDLMYLQNLLENGDIDEQVYKDSVESMCVDSKFESICMVMKNLEAQASAYKAEIDRMTARKKTLENGIQRLKDSMMNYMLQSNDKKIEAGLFTVSVGMSKSVHVYDESALPERFLKPQPPKIDKTAISNALKAGEEVEGATIAESPYVSIR